VIDSQNAEAFDSYMKKYPKLYDHLAEVIKKNTQTSGTIVDIGCGTGLLLLSIHKILPQAKLIGIEPSNEMRKIALKNVQLKNTIIKKGTSEKTTLSDSSVDVLVSRFSLPYWKNPETSFQELFRILKPKGTLILEALNKEYPSWKLSMIKWQMIFKRAPSTVISYHVDAYSQAYGPNQLKKLLETSGFKVVFHQGKKSEWKYMIVAKK
jgi:ubiquinone/menaquinone biosynthesis C-methylase UbiE